jgi:hypothetical protein
MTSSSSCLSTLLNVGSTRRTLASFSPSKATFSKATFSKATSETNDILFIYLSIYVIIYLSNDLFIYLFLQFWAYLLRHFDKLNHARPICYKTFDKSMNVCKKGFVPDSPFQPSLIFESKAGAYLREAAFRCVTLG